MPNILGLKFKPKELQLRKKIQHDKTEQHVFCFRTFATDISSAPINALTIDAADSLQVYQIKVSRIPNQSANFRLQPVFRSRLP